MQRFHINLTVSDLDRSIGFYTTLFGAEPSKCESDYAKWMLDDPRINFAISTHGKTPGIDHVGLQADDEPGLADIRSRLEQADAPIFDQEDVSCCYARSTKAWIRDPDGVAWETFVSHGDTAVYGDGARESAMRIAGNDEIAGNENGCCGSADEETDTRQSCC